MASEVDTAQRRAEFADIARKLVLQINEITPTQWDKHDEKDLAIVLAALVATAQQARREALEEARGRFGMLKKYLANGRVKEAQELIDNTIQAIDRLREGVEGT